MSQIVYEIKKEAGNYYLVAQLKDMPQIEPMKLIVRDAMEWTKARARAKAVLQKGVI